VLTDQIYIERSAKLLAQDASIPKHFKCPSTLYWCRKKRGKGYRRKVVVYDYYPCRECHPDEAMYISLQQEWDNEAKDLIQHIEKRMFSDREIVPRSKLVIPPYYGGKPGETCIEGKSQWCADLVELLLPRLRSKALSQIKKKRKQAESNSVGIIRNVQSEVFYMKRILECALERQEESTLDDLHHRHDETEPLKAQSALVSQDVDDTDEINGLATRIAGVNTVSISLHFFFALLVEDSTKRDPYLLSLITNYISVLLLSFFVLRSW
jgi:hypothetical protein